MLARSPQQRPVKARRLTRAAATAAVVMLCPGAGRGQSTLDIIRTYVPSDSLTYMLWSVGALLMLFFGLLLLVAIRRSRQSSVLTDSLQDFTQLQSKGLLTAEEAKAVRAAMAKQLLERKDAAPVTPGKASGLGAEALLMIDPEVQRLEELAARKISRPTEEARPSGPTPRAAQATGDDLPPEVARLYEQGLLTEEDVAAIRARAKEKHHPQG